MKKVLKYLTLILVLVIAIPTFFVLINGEAFFQDPKDVVLRDCGGLKLGPPAPASDMAKEDLPFAPAQHSGVRHRVRRERKQATPVVRS